MPRRGLLAGPTLREPARSIPVVHECDVCVVGGSCTGVFAAVRAAQRGCTVALLEAGNMFGGVATRGLVSIWHSLWDTIGRRQIIAGLTLEMIERLRRREAVRLHGNSPDKGATLNTAELAIELDDLVRSQPRIRPFLHTRFVAPVERDGRIVAAVIEDRSGRRAVAARVFIDASGDGDLLVRAGFETRTLPDLQPPTTCALIHGIDAVARRSPGFNLAAAVHDPRYPNALRDGLLWSAPVTGVPGATMVAGTRVHGADCGDADQLTAAEMEGRRQVRAICDILREQYEGGDGISLIALPASIGIRETRHAVCQHTLTEAEVLEGLSFPDAIANGSYRVDVHHSSRAGLTFRYLDGTEFYHAPGQAPLAGRWRGPRDVDPTFYQIPLRSLLPLGSRNLIAAGRLVDADRGAYGAVRVMVNCNQTGEAAGVLAALAVGDSVDV
ncbi:MAG: FAD-dependent oxidoreductase, partial [Lentisphaeria bacterium]|nr:FAD-dependent oxidoreductase [Lentisphaeria bacterium]